MSATVNVSSFDWAERSGIEQYLFCKRAYNYTHIRSLFVTISWKQQALESGKNTFDAAVVSLNEAHVSFNFEQTTKTSEEKTQSKLRLFSRHPFISAHTLIITYELNRTENSTNTTEKKWFVLTHTVTHTTPLITVVHSHYSVYTYSE